MNWKAYKNELIVGASMLFLLIGLIYKQEQVLRTTKSLSMTEKRLHELKEIISLKKIWADKKTSKKVDRLQTLVAPSKVKWQKKSKKLVSHFSSLSASELNRLISKMLNLAVQIQKLSIQKSGAVYSVEFICKW